MIVKRDAEKFKPFTVSITFETAEEVKAIKYLTSYFGKSDVTTPTYVNIQYFLQLLREEID